MDHRVRSVRQLMARSGAGYGSRGRPPLRPRHAPPKRPAMPPTKTDETMESAEKTFASSDPERASVIACARRFKSSWIELAAALTRVKRGGQWSLWGYDTFEHYAKSELRLRQETVDKLTGSYVFLQKRAPAVLD